MAIVKKATIEKKKKIVRKSFTEATAVKKPLVTKKKPTASPELLAELSQKKCIPASRQIVRCDNNDCKANSMFKQSHRGVEAECLASTVKLVKTWAGHVDNYKLRCTTASDYVVSKEDTSFNLGREHEIQAAIKAKSKTE